MRVLIAAGGTGGHLYPGIALAQAFAAQGRGDEIAFVGTRQGIEARVLPREGYALETIEVEGLAGRGLWAQAKALRCLPGAAWSARRVIQRFRPDVVVGIGGYVSGPVVMAASTSGSRRVLLEPNVIPGLTNRWLAPFADCVVVAFEASRPYFRMARVEVLGTPVRPEVVRARDTRQAVPEGGRSGVHATLLIVGGSQGARTLNRAMVAALEDLKDLDLTYVHQTGESDWAIVRDAYHRRDTRAQVEPYIEDMASVYRVADLAVSRAGGTTLSELTVVGLPAVLVPYPHATHGHQEQNARVLSEAGAAEVIRDDDLTGLTLAAAVRRLLSDRSRLAGMAKRSRAMGRPAAAEQVAARCRALVE